MAEADRGALYQQTAGRLPVGYVAGAAEIAEAYIYLMRRATAPVSLLVVDGGADWFDLLLLHKAAIRNFHALVAIAVKRTYADVTAIVPLSAGSAADILARQLATKMSEGWSQPVVVENRPGAGTTIGTDAVAMAAPDGHTLLVNSAAFAASAAIYPKLPYDPLKDLAPVSQIAVAPIVVVAAPSLGAKSIKLRIHLATGKPGLLELWFSRGRIEHPLRGEQFKLAAGINAVHATYKDRAKRCSTP